MKLKEAAALYVAEKRERRRESTVEGYASALRCHVLPRWGECRIEDIDPADIQEWVDGFEKPGAALKAWKTLRQVVRWAIRRLRLRVWDPAKRLGFLSRYGISADGPAHRKHPVRVRNRPMRPDKAVRLDRHG